MLDKILSIAQIALSILLVIAILLQARGTGLGGVFGGEGNIYRTKRGVERMLFFATIALAILFFGVAFLLKYTAEHNILPIEFRLLGVCLGAIALLIFGWRLRH